MNRLLGVDAGEARIGLAICDEEGHIAVPLAIIERKGRGLEWAARVIAEQARRHGAQGLIVGLPVNMDGSFGAQAVRARALGRRAATAAELPLEFWDERMSSFIAEQRVAALPPSRRSRHADDIAAAVILQSYLDRNAATEPEGVVNPSSTARDTR